MLLLSSSTGTELWLSCETAHSWGWFVNPCGVTQSNNGMRVALLYCMQPQQKVSTSTTSGKVFRDIKIWVCKLSAREYFWAFLFAVKKRLNQCCIMEICWDSLPFILLSLPLISHQYFLPTYPLLLLGVFCQAVASVLIFLFHYCLLKSISFPNKCHYLPFFVFCLLFFIWPVCKKAATSCLSRKEGWNWACWDLSMGFQVLWRGTVGVWDTDIWIIKCVVQALSSPWSARECGTRTDAEIVPSNKTQWQIFLAWTDLYSALTLGLALTYVLWSFQASITFSWFSNQIWYRCSISHCCKLMHANDGHAIMPQQLLSLFSCRQLFLKAWRWIMWHRKQKIKGIILPCLFGSSVAAWRIRNLFTFQRRFAAW